MKSYNHRFQMTRGGPGKVQEAGLGAPALSTLSSTMPPLKVKNILKEHSPGPNLEQFNLGLEREILTQTPLPWALPLPSVPQPCATSSSDPVLQCCALVPPLCSCLHSTSSNQHKFTQISRQHQTKLN